MSTARSRRSQRYRAPDRKWCASPSIARRRLPPFRISATACAEALDKYRINPGNVGFKNKRDTQFADIIEIANKNNKPVRIGANWGSLDQELLTKLMDENTASANPRDARAVTREAMVQSALLS